MTISSSRGSGNGTQGQSSLGTLLRHLTDLLDSAVEHSYSLSGLDYRPRYTPVFRALLDLGSTSIRAISDQAGISHSAVSQTVAEMVKNDWLTSVPGGDARERIIALTKKAEAAAPILKRHWMATNTAAESLDRELSVRLSDLLREAIELVGERPFCLRIAEASVELEVKS